MWPYKLSSRARLHNHVTSRHVTSRHVTSRHVTSRHVTSRHVTSRHVTSRHVTSRHVTSRHVYSRQNHSWNRFTWLICGCVYNPALRWTLVKWPFCPNSLNLLHDTKDAPTDVGPTEHSLRLKHTRLRKIYPDVGTFFRKMAPDTSRDELTIHGVAPLAWTFGITTKQFYTCSNQVKTTHAPTLDT